MFAAMKRLERSNSACSISDTLTKTASLGKICRDYMDKSLIRCQNGTCKAGIPRHPQEHTVVDVIVSKNTVAKQEPQKSTFFNLKRILSLGSLLGEEK